MKTKSVLKAFFPGHLFLTPIRTFCLVIAFYPVFNATCQIPQGFIYQAIARDGLTGDLLTNQSLQVRLTIQSDSLGGTIFWQELHSPVITNSTGMFTVIAGKGTRQTPSTVAKFSDIDWKVTPKFIKTEVYYKGEWKNMGSSGLWSVPYSMAAKELAGSVKKLTVVGETTLMDEPLFEVKNKDGKTVFAVYNEGVRVYVDDGISGKGAKGGFAIGSFDSSKGIYQDYFIVNADSIRAYINTDTLKGKKGGFAIGGFDPSKAEREEFLRVTRDSTRVYLNNTLTKGRKGGFAIGSFDESKGIYQDYVLVSKDSIRMFIDKAQVKGVKGGFAIGGFDESKKYVSDLLKVTIDSTRIFTSNALSGFAVGNIGSDTKTGYMKLTPENYFIGHESGLDTKPGSGYIGKYNSFLGYQSGRKNTIGRYNVYLGYQSGFSNVDGSYNVFIGNETGYKNADGNYNTFIGHRSGNANIGGDGNIFLGYQAGLNNTEGSSNIFIGYNSGYRNTTANGNIYIGFNAGLQNRTGINNIYLGYQAGRQGSKGSNNIFIGYRAGYNDSTDYKLYIGNSETSAPLVFGELDNKRLIINGYSADNPLNYNFYVNGTAGGDFAWNNLSDMRLKKNIEPIEKPLEKVLTLRGVTFEWKDENSPEKGKRLGFIAQEAAEVIPEVVNSSGEYMSMQYGPVSALIVEAIKEQQKIIDQQNLRIKQIEEMNRILSAKIEEISKEMESMKQK